MENIAVQRNICAFWIVLHMRTWACNGPFDHQVVKLFGGATMCHHELKGKPKIVGCIWITEFLYV